MHLGPQKLTKRTACSLWSTSVVGLPGSKSPCFWQPCATSVSYKLTSLLTLPNASQTRHHTFLYGEKQRENVAAVSRKLHQIILEDMTFITKQCELLKQEELAPNEVMYIWQWECFVIFVFYIYIYVITTVNYIREYL